MLCSFVGQEVDCGFSDSEAEALTRTHKVCQCYFSLQLFCINYSIETYQRN